MRFEIVVPTVAYTLLFLGTGRLLAPIAAHASYKASAILCVQRLYAPAEGVVPALAALW